LKSLRYFLVDVFTDHPFSGNQLAVFPDGGDLTKESMQKIAREFNLSETTFVFPKRNDTSDFHVRIFTPTTELPMAGHPTIGTAFVLAHLRTIPSREQVIFEEQIGPVPISLQYDVNDSPSWISMTQPLPKFGSRFENTSSISEMLSLEESAIDSRLPLEVVSCGVPFLFIPLKDLSSIRRVRLKMDVWERLLKNFEAPQVFVFTQEVELPTSRVHCRMFAPALGIVEDPATGGASGPLGCYLVKNKILQAFPNAADFISEQGFEMGRPSLIRIIIAHGPNGEFAKVVVSGQCCMIGEGTIRS